jgi:hypothetical protein
MSLPTQVIKQLEKLIQENVNRFFGPLKAAEKTPDKVSAFAQKQLDFFITGMAKESREFQTMWAKGHPYHTRLRMNPSTQRWEIEIMEDDGRI